MTATIERTRPVATGRGSGQANRDAKAAAIGRWCWDRKISAAELSGLVLAGNPKLRRKLAREAGEARDPGALSWRKAVELMLDMEQYAKANPGDPRIVRHHVDERPTWLDTTTELAPAEPDTVGALVTAELVAAVTAPPVEHVATEPTVELQPIPDVATNLAPARPEGGWPGPRGWDELCQLGPLDHAAEMARTGVDVGWCFKHPGRRPVTITKGDGGRCEECPPRNDEVLPAQASRVEGTDSQGRPTVTTVPPPPGATAIRDGWGQKLNHAYTFCKLPLQCACGRPCAGESRALRPHFSEETR